MPATAAQRTVKPRTVTLPTSLKLPSALKREIDELAGERGISSHSFMVQTLADAAARARLHAQFVTDAEDALHGMQESGTGYELASVRAYFGKLAAWRQGKGQKPRRPVPVKVA